jgi:hypothetical protein
MMSCEHLGKGTWICTRGRIGGGERVKLLMEENCALEPTKVEREKSLGETNDGEGNQDR